MNFLKRIFVGITGLLIPSNADFDLSDISTVPGPLHQCCCVVAFVVDLLSLVVTSLLLVFFFFFFFSLISFVFSCTPGTGSVVITFFPCMAD